MKNHTLSLLTAICLASTGVAHASTIISGSGLISSATLTATSAAGATSSPFMLGNFGNAGDSSATLLSTAPIQISNGTITFSPDGSVPQAGLWSGTTSGIAASPFVGTNLPQGNYLAAEPNDPVTIRYSSLQSAFSLLWGTVDTYNNLNLDLYAGSVELGMLTVTGSEVASAAGISANGTTPAFVTVNDFDFGPLPSTFDRIVVTSTSPAFEFDPSVQVPEPGSLALLGAGLIGLRLVTRRKGMGAAAAAA